MKNTTHNCFHSNEEENFRPCPHFQIIQAYMKAPGDAQINIYYMNLSNISCSAKTKSVFELGFLSSRLLIYSTCYGIPTGFFFTFSAAPVHGKQEDPDLCTQSSVLLLYMSNSTRVNQREAKNGRASTEATQRSEPNSFFPWKYKREDCFPWRTCIC